MSNFGGRAGHRRFASALILLTLLAGVTTAGYGLYAWRVAKADEYARLDNLVQFAAKSSNFFFDQFANTLGIIGQDILDQDGLNNLKRGHRLLAQYQHSARGVATINLFLPDGRWVLSSAVPPGTALPAASTIPNWQAGIRAAADGAGLSVGRPFKGIVTPGLVIPLRYPVRDASGRVVFLLSALIPLHNQQEIWSNVELPDDGWVGLVRSDGYLQSRFPIAGSEEQVYEQRWDGPVFRAAFATGTRGSGHIEASSPEDGQQRFIAYHNLQGYPLTAFIAAPSAQVWSLWVGRVQVPFALFAILALGSISIYRHMSLQYESWGHALHLQRERLELLNRISAGVTAGTPFDRLVQLVLEQLAQSFPNTRVSFGTVSPSGRLQFVGSRGCAGLPGVIGLEVDLNLAPQWLQILRAGRPVVADDLAGDARAAPLTALLGSIRARACLHVPLQYPGGLLGALCVDATTPRAWSDEETAMVSEVASYMALALTEARAGEERSRALADLQESRERFRSLAEMSSDWFWEQDQHFRFTFVSGSAGRHLFDKPEESLGKTRWEIAHIEGVTPEDWQEHRRLLEAHEPFADFVYKYRYRGRIRLTSISGGPILDQDGRFLGYRGTGKDITAQKESEERIRYLAHNDELTGLTNRTSFQEQLGHALQEHQ
jgi:PAS domain S-box-containing protein